MFLCGEYVGYVRGMLWMLLGKREGELISLARVPWKSKVLIKEDSSVRLCEMDLDDLQQLFVPALLSHSKPANKKAKLLRHQPSYSPAYLRYKHTTMTSLHNPTASSSPYTSKRDVGLHHSIRGEGGLVTPAHHTLIALQVS